MRLTIAAARDDKANNAYHYAAVIVLRDFKKVTRNPMEPFAWPTFRRPPRYAADVWRRWVKNAGLMMSVQYPLSLARYHNGAPLSLSAGRLVSRVLNRPMVLLCRATRTPC